MGSNPISGSTRSSPRMSRSIQPNRRAVGVLAVKLEELQKIAGRHVVRVMREAERVVAR